MQGLVFMALGFRVQVTPSAVAAAAARRGTAALRARERHGGGAQVELRRLRAAGWRWQALGREEGGSGVPLQRAAYTASVAYWKEHAAIVAGELPSGD